MSRWARERLRDWLFADDAAFSATGVTIGGFPKCKYHFFLSHCREDRNDLVIPVFGQLQELALIPWLDRHHYPVGRPPFSALRDSLLNCRHIVFFITEAMVTQARGWPVIELAWADLIQSNLVGAAGTYQHLSLPLFFVAPDDPRILQSAWQPLLERGSFHSPASGNRVQWAVDRIRKFLLQEQEFAQNWLEVLQQDDGLRRSLERRRGLFDRVTARHPMASVPGSE